MKKLFVFFSVVALILVSCSKDEVVINNNSKDDTQTSQDEFKKIASTVYETQKHDNSLKNIFKITHTANSITNDSYSLENEFLGRAEINLDESGNYTSYKLIIDNEILSEINYSYDNLNRLIEKKEINDARMNKPSGVIKYLYESVKVTIVEKYDGNSERESYLFLNEKGLFYKCESFSTVSEYIYDESNNLIKTIAINPNFDENQVTTYEFSTARIHADNKRFNPKNITILNNALLMDFFYGIQPQKYNLNHIVKKNYNNGEVTYDRELDSIGRLVYEKKIFNGNGFSEFSYRYE